MQIPTKLAMILLGALGLTAARCDPTVPDSLEGEWGGEHVTLRVTATGATIEYDCAHGTIDEPLRPDRRGEFSAVGVHVREHGGPVREGEVPDAHPARYTGEVRDSRMNLAVQLTDTGETVGEFVLERGAPGRVFKCL